MANSRQMHVLLVEDNEADIELMMLIMKRMSNPYQVTVISDGEAAIDYIVRTAKNDVTALPDLILLDLNLPRRSGFDVLGELKTRADTKTLPILVMTTSARPSDIQRSYELHANCYITKPTDLQAFNVIMRRIEEFWLETAQLPVEITSGIR